MRETFHLVPAEDWDAAATSTPYRADSLDTEGFIHCTDGEVELLRTAERYYRSDPRPFLALTIDLDRVGARWTLDDPARIYPHVYGPIPREAIVAVRSVTRAPDGTFLGIEARR